MDSKTKKSIITFVLLSFLISTPFYYFVASGKMLEMAQGLMWCPAFAAIIVSLLYHRGENAMNFRKSSLKSNLTSLWLFLGYAGISYGIYFLIYGSDVLVENVMMKQLLQSPVMLLINLVLYFLTALGEEIGWSGYLTPKLVGRFGFVKGSLLVGIIWTAWHMPVFASGYMADIPLWYQLTMLTALCIVMSFLRSYITMKSNSVWPGAILHAIHNFVLQVVLDQSIGGEMRPYLLGETGALTVAVMLVIAVICAIKYSKNTLPIHTNIKNLA